MVARRLIHLAQRGQDWRREHVELYAIRHAHLLVRFGDPGVDLRDCGGDLRQSGTFSRSESLTQIPQPERC